VKIEIFSSSSKEPPKNSSTPLVIFELIFHLCIRRAATFMGTLQVVLGRKTILFPNCPIDY